MVGLPLMNVAVVLPIFIVMVVVVESLTSTAFPIRSICVSRKSSLSFGVQLLLISFSDESFTPTTYFQRHRSDQRSRIFDLSFVILAMMVIWPTSL